VTSAAPGEGATTVAVTLAHESARSGKKVLIVDGVRANWSLSRATAASGGRRSTKLPGRSGLFGTSVVSDERTGLDVLSIGDLTAIDSDVVWWNHMDEVLHEVTVSYDLVVIDLPSLASGPEVRMAAQMLDGLLLVLKWGGTPAELVQRRLDLSGGARSKFVGVVLNLADERLIGRYGDKLAGAEASLAARRPVMDDPGSAGPAHFARAS